MKKLQIIYLVVFFYTGLASLAWGDRTCYFVDSYLTESPSALHFPCFETLEENLKNQLNKDQTLIREHINEKLDISKSKNLAGKFTKLFNSDPINDLFIDRFKVSAIYSTDLAEVNDLVFNKEDKEEFGIALIYEFPFNAFKEGSRKRFTEMKGIYESKVKLDSLLENSMINLTKLYQEFEQVKFEHDNCVCSRSYESNCNLIFYQLKQKAIQTLYYSKFETDGGYLNNWKNSYPIGC